MSSISFEGSEKKKGLGRGLGSLFGDVEISRPQQPAKETISAPIEKNSPYKLIDIEAVIPNPQQPRKHFSEEKLAELSLSIKAHGIIQPVVVAPIKDGKHQIIAGERRWRASQIAGLKQIPVIIKEANESKTLELAIIENIQRQDLNPIEEARAYLHLIKKFGHTQNEVAEKVGKDRATVANTLRILTLDAEIIEMVSSGKLSMGHAKALLSVDNKMRQRTLARRAATEHLSVRALERLTSQQAPAEDIQINQAQPIKTKETIHCEALAAELEKKLGTKTKIDYQNGKGSISISFYSKDQFNEIAEKLKGLSI